MDYFFKNVFKPSLKGKIFPGLLYNIIFKPMLAMTTLLALLTNTVSSAEPENVYVPIINMSDIASKGDAKFNSWGGEKKASLQKLSGIQGKFNKIIRLNYSNSSSTLSLPKLNDFISKTIDKNPISGVYFWYRTKEMKGASWVEYHDGNRFAYKYGLKLDNRWRKVNIPVGGWNKEQKLLDKKNLKTAYFVFNGSGTIDIGEIGVFYSYKSIAGKLRRPPFLLRIPEDAKTHIVVDGEIKASEWKGAGVIPHLRGTNGSFVDKNNRTVVYLKVDELGLYCAAKCFKSDMSKLKSDITSNSVRIYEDESMEFYFDIGRTTCSFKKIAVNSNGCLGGVTKSYDNSGILVSTKKYANRWEVEMLFPWKFLSKTNAIPFVAGFNTTRNCYDNEDIERSGWSTTVWNAVDKFGVLEFTKSFFPNATFDQIAPKFWELQNDGYIIIGDTTNKLSQYNVFVDTPLKNRYSFNKTFKTSGSDVFATPFKFPIRKSGRYHIGVVVNSKESGQEYFETNISKELYTSLKSVKIDEVRLFPIPKVFINKPGRTRFNSMLKILSLAKENKFALKRFKIALKSFYGINVTSSKSIADADIIIGLGSNPSISNLLKKLKFTKEYEKIRYDGFALYVDNGVALVTAKESRGLFYGINALLNLIKMSSSDVGPAEINHCRVVDWPRTPIRFIHQMMQSYYHRTKYEPKFFCDMLYKYPMNFRFNGFLFEVSNYYDWHAAKVGLGKNLAWTRKEYENVVDYINGCSMPVMPSIQSLGHMKWWIFNKKGIFPDLKEDGCNDVLCTGNPKTYKLLFDLYDEDWKICSRNPKQIPKYFFTSLDEVRWKTNATPLEKRCKRCAGKPKNKIYLDHIKKLDKYIRAKGAKMMMCSDMVVEAHNGLNEFKCAKIVKDIPKDIIMCHWSGRDMPAIAKFKKMGFENWKFCTSYQESLVGEKNTDGYCFNICTYNWWLSKNRCTSNGGYGLMAQALFANNCWNSLPKDGASAWQRNVKLYGNFLMRNWSRKALLHANGQINSIDLSGIVNKPLIGANSLFGEGSQYDLSYMNLKTKKVGGVPIRIILKKDIPEGIVLDEKERMATIPLSKKVGSIILLQGAHLRKNGAKTFWNPENYKDPLKGKNIVKYSVSYLDGSKTSFHIRYGWNISEWRINPLKISEVLSKYVPDSRFLWEGKTPYAVKSHLPNDIALYQYEWVNPHPEKLVRTITLKSVNPYVSYVLLAASFRGVKN